MQTHPKTALSPWNPNTARSTVFRPLRSSTWALSGSFSSCLRWFLSGSPLAVAAGRVQWSQSGGNCHWHGTSHVRKRGSISSSPFPFDINPVRRVASVVLYLVSPFPFDINPVQRVGSVEYIRPHSVSYTRRKLVHYNRPLRLVLGKCIKKYQYDCQLEYFS